MVKAEGWLSKTGSKWKTMPQLMFRYRAAAFFARIYAPDITLGMQTAEEIYDAPPEPRNVTPVTAHVEPIANPYLPPPKPEPEPAPKPAPKPEPTAEPAPELPMEPASKVQTIRGYFDRYETADSPENAKKPWRRYDLFFTVAGGPERKASTFSASVAEPLEWLSEGDEIVVEVEEEARGLKLLSVEKAQGGEA